MDDSSGHRISGADRIPSVFPDRTLDHCAGIWRPWRDTLRPDWNEATQGTPGQNCIAVDCRCEGWIRPVGQSA